MADYSLVPVEHQPDFENASLVPVDHNPFGDSGTVQQAQFQQPQTQPAPQPKPQLSPSGAGQPAVNGPAAGSVSGGSSGSVAEGNTAIGLNHPTAAPGSASGDSSSMGKSLLRSAINAVPGAYHSGLAQQQFRQGNYGVAALYGLEALADAALGIATLGASTRLATGVRAAETLAPAPMEGAGRAAAEEARALTSRVGLSPAEWAAKKGFPGIGTTANGGPTFAATEHLYPAAGEQRSIVRIKLTGSRKNDSRLANKEGKFAETPEGYRWHHVDDFDPLSGEATLELVSEKSHNATLRHVGSVGQYAKHHGIPYKR